MLVTFLKRLSYKDLKTVKALKIRQSSSRIIMVLKNHEKCAILFPKIDFFSNFESRYLRTSLLYFQCFYSFEILIGQSLQKSYYHVLSSCLIFWRQSWHVIFPPKCNKIEKQKRSDCEEVSLYSKLRSESYN
jgi:hypothetical protein